MCRYSCMDALDGRELNVWRKRLTAATQEQYCTRPERSTPPNSCCTASYQPSRKLSNLDEPDMQDIAGKVETNSKGTYSCEPLHMNEQRQDDQLDPTYSSAVRIRDVTLRTCRKRWTIEKVGGRGSGISVLQA